MISKENFSDIFKLLWWSLMDYAPSEEKISTYYKNLSHYSLQTIKKVADQLQSNDRFPTLEVWRGMCFKYDRPNAPEIDVEPVTDRGAAMGNIVMKYYTRKLTGQEAYDEIIALPVHYKVIVDNFQWLHGQGLFEFGGEMPEEERI